MTRPAVDDDPFAPRLVTVFDGDIDEERLDNLSMWLWQEEFEGFESLHCQFEYTLQPRSIRCRFTERIADDRLPLLAAEIDRALSRIVRDVGFRTGTPPTGLVEH